MPRHLKVLVALGPAILLAGCGQSEQETAAADAATATPTDTAIVAATPISYDCLPAQRLTASYDNSTDPSKAILTLDGQTYELTAAIAASGVRYVTEQGRSPGKTLVWWTRGQDGTLYEGTAGNPDAAETQIAECSPAAAPAG